MHVTRIQQNAKSLRVNIFARNCTRWPPPTFQGLCPSFSRPLPLLFEAAAHPIQGLWNKTRPRPNKRRPWKPRVYICININIYDSFAWPAWRLFFIARCKRDHSLADFYECATPWTPVQRHMCTCRIRALSLPELMDFIFFGKTILVVNKKCRLFLASQLGR